MTPEEISYIREWAESGNEPRNAENIPRLRAGLTTATPDWDFVKHPFVVLTDPALTISALAEALEQANEVAEDLAVHKEKGRVTPEQFVQIETMRANKRRLLG